MRFVLTTSEILFLKNKFGFSRLLGINEKKRIRLGTERALKEKSIIYPYNGKDELDPTYRALLTNWEQTRYTVARSDINDEQTYQCLLCSENAIIFMVDRQDEVTIDLLDFSEELMDRMLGAFAELPSIESSETAFNVTLFPEECEQFLTCRDEADFRRWQCKLGINARVLRKYAEAIHAPGGSATLMAEDHLEDVGYMGKFVADERAVYALKHVTGEEYQKMVLVMGDTQYVVNSIYNF